MRVKLWGRGRRRGLGETPPPPNEPLFPTASDTEAYLAWLKARVDELDAAVQSFIPTMPDRVAAGQLTLQRVQAITSSLVGWNGWLLAWRQYAQNLSEQSWAGMVKRHVELEQWRSVFAGNGVTVPEPTKVPQGTITKDGGNGLERAASKISTGLVIAFIVGAGIFAWRASS